MRALTLRPHWAHAVAHLGKRIENRTRPIPPALVGQRVAIHAGARLPEEMVGWLPHRPHRWILDLGLASPTSAVDSVAFRMGYSARWRNACTWDADGTCRVIVTRAIVATAVLREPFVTAADWRNDGARADELPPWADPDADYWWGLDHVIPLSEPVPVRRGQLGLWRLAPDVAAAIDAAGGWG